MIYCFIISLLTKKILSDTTCHVHHIFRKKHPIRFHMFPPPSPHLVPGSQGRRWRRQETPAPQRRRPCRCCRSGWSRRCSAPSWTQARPASRGCPGRGWCPHLCEDVHIVHMTHVYMILDVYLTVYQFIYWTVIRPNQEICMSLGPHLLMETRFWICKVTGYSCWM